MAKSTGKFQTEGVTVSVHGNIVVGPIFSTSLPVAKYAAAERAMAMLKDGETDKSLAHLCDCGKHMETDNTGPASVEDGAKLNNVFDEELDAEDAAEVDRIMTTDIS
jgi:endoribonuclease Dicer